MGLVGQNKTWGEGEGWDMQKERPRKVWIVQITTLS